MQVCGVGGAASVFVAVDLRLGRSVALKLIHPEVAGLVGQRRRVIEEARLAAQVDHRNVVGVLDLGEAEVAGVGRPFVVMPIIHGRTLREILLDGAVTWRRALDLGRQLLAGLGAIHAVGARHGDVKPENCIVSAEDDGELLRIGDFGLARHVGDGLGQVNLGGVVLGRGRLVGRQSPDGQVGTALYAAPELARGEALDARSDVYAAGVVIYEMLARRPPFVGEAAAVLAAHADLGVRAPPIEAVARGGAPAVPPAVEDAVAGALAKTPADRFASAGAFGRALADAEVRALADAGLAGAGRCGAPAHAGADAALASLAAWTRFEYADARAAAAKAARAGEGWAPLALLMSAVAEE